MSEKYELEEVPCNLCGSTRSRTLFTATDTYVDLVREPYSVVQCLDCGLAYLSPRIPEKAIGDFYPDDIYLLKDDGADRKVRGLENFYLLHLFRHQMDKALKTAAGLGITPRSVFDIGCGPGHRLSLYKERGMEVAGLEISTDAEYARRQYGIDVFRGTLEEYLEKRGQKKTYDIVTCYYVAEHFFDPMGSFEKIKRILAPGGMFALVVPNFGSVQAGVFKGRWTYTEVPRHTYFYTRETLGSFLDKAGYDVKGFSTMTNFWHPPSIVLSMFPSLDPRFNWREENSGAPGTKALLRRVAWVAATLALSPLAYLECLAGRGALLSAYAVKRGPA
jgi:SAM-dependent methyltransferase